MVLLLFAGRDRRRTKRLLKLGLKFPSRSMFHNPCGRSKVKAMTLTVEEREKPVHFELDKFNHLPHSFLSASLGQGKLNPRRREDFTLRPLEY